MAFEQAPKNIISTKEDGRGYLDALTNKYIVKPKNAKGIGGFVFDYEGETSVTHQAEITDHFSEDNQTINDHVARRPAKLNLRGFQSELVQKKPNAITGLLNTLQNKLTTVPAYLGKYTPQMIGKVQAALTQAQNVVNKVNQGMARVQNIVGFFSRAAPGDTKQKQAYNTLLALFNTSTVFTVETPYGYFDKMVIEGLSFVQPDESRTMSDITITLKQLRFAEVLNSTSNDETFGGRAGAQRDALADKGKTKGSDTPTSTLYRALPASLQALVP